MHPQPKLARRHANSLACLIIDHPRTPQTQNSPARAAPPIRDLELSHGRNLALRHALLAAKPGHSQPALLVLVPRRIASGTEKIWSISVLPASTSCCRPFEASVRTIQDYSCITTVHRVLFSPGHMHGADERHAHPHESRHVAGGPLDWIGWGRLRPSYQEEPVAITPAP